MSRKSIQRGKQSNTDENSMNNTSILDMTLTLMENTVENSPWPEKTDLLILSSTLNKVISRKKRSNSKIKTLTKEVERESNRYRQEIQTFQTNKENEYSSQIQNLENLKETLSSLLKENEKLEKEDVLSEDTLKLRTELKHHKAEFKDCQSKLEHLEASITAMNHLKERELEKYEGTVAVLEKANSKISTENQTIEDIQNSLQNFDSEIQKNEEIIEDLKTGIKNFNQNKTPEEEEREIVSQMLNEMKSEFDSKKLEIKNALKLNIQEEGKIAHERIKEEHKIDLEEVITEFKNANSEFYKFKKELGETELETKRVENEIEKKKEDKEEILAKYNHAKECLQNNEYSKVNKEVENLRRIEEIIGNKNEEKELELGNLASNTQKYKIYLSDLIKRLKEEEMGEN